MNIVIIGGGIAGTIAAEELRKRLPDASIILISEEQHHLYSRVLLPHFLKGKVPRERVFLKKITWYAENNIEWMPGMRVTKLDPKNKFVELSDGRELPYDKVLITTGAEIRPIGHDLRGVSYFRTLDDADHLLQILGQLREEAKAGVYGGGFIACEYINFFADRKIPTTVAMRSGGFWSKILDEESQKFISDHLVENGVEIQTNASLEGLVGDPDLEGFVTEKGKIECNVLGIGIGIASDMSWIEEAGVEINGGVLTNEYLETNVEDVYAAGDIAEFQDVVIDRKVIAGNWMNAQMQARAVAKIMTGEREPFRLVSSYATNVLGLKMTFIGDTSRKHADSIVIRKTEGVTQLFIRNGKLVGATMIGSAHERTVITKLIDSQEDVSSRIEQWKDPSIELK